MRQNEITVPKTPNNSIVVKFLKNCFFLTWKLRCTPFEITQNKSNIMISTEILERARDDNHTYPALKMIGGSK